MEYVCHQNGKSFYSYHSKPNKIATVADMTEYPISVNVLIESYFTLRRKLANTNKGRKYN